MVVAEERIEIPVKDLPAETSSPKKGRRFLVFAGVLFFHAAVSCWCHPPREFFGKRSVLPKRHHLPRDTSAKYYSFSSVPDARCLDGTFGGMYFSPAQTTQAKNKWIIYFQGGGWCYDLNDCLQRSTTSFGSSSSWPQERQLNDGILSDDCSLNPTFCNYNRVYLPYCDGNSFAGDVDEPIIVQGKKIYFHGARILNAALQTLLGRFGLKTATEVLLSGSRAGGLAAYLHTNKVGDYLAVNVPSLQRFKSAPVSGFFLAHSNVLGKNVYPDQMTNIFHLSNARNGVDPRCIRGHVVSKNEHLCMFAQYTYDFIVYPVFIINSKFDAWQIPCIFTAEAVSSNSSANGDCGAVPGWEACAHDPTKCTPDQMVAMDDYQRSFETGYGNSPIYSHPGQGVFIDNTYEHGAAASKMWSTLSIGGVTMHDAVLKWWNDPITTPTAANVHVCKAPWPGAC